MAQNTEAQDSSPKQSKRLRRRAQGGGSDWIADGTRYAIYHRDGFMCVYCGIRAEDGVLPMGLDHVIACDAGGSDAPTNLVTACHSCNSTKRHMSTRAWYLWLRVTKGLDTTKLSKRIRRLLVKPLDLQEGRRLAKQRRNHELNQCLAEIRQMMLGNTTF